MKKTSRTWLSISLYIISLILLFVGTFMASGRLFAFTFFQQSSIIFLIFTIVLLLKIPLLIYVKRNDIEKLFENDISKSSYQIVAGSLFVLLGLLFYFFKANYHFLGDGYGLVSLLSNANPLFVKLRNYGESLLHLWVYGIVGSAYVTYQTISIITGLLYYLLSIALVKEIFTRYLDRLLALIGIVSLGNMLLFFGYVENYAIFNLSVLLFVYIAVLILKKRISRFFIILAWGITIFFHMFGLFLLPAVIYLLFEPFLKKIPNRRLLVFSSLLTLFGLIALYLIAQRDYFIQISLLPLIARPFTPDGYTLFSIKHITDFVQVLFILFPGSFIILSIVKAEKSKTKALDRFLIVATSFVLLGLFLIDPKLGMARDWDLYAFSSVPLGLLLIYRVLSQKKYLILLLALSLSTTVLVGRVSLVNSETKSIGYFKTALENDRIKNRNSWAVLINYYKINAQPDKAKRMQDEWNREFPENSLIQLANTNVYQKLTLKEAFRLAREALEINPAYPDAYSFMGYCHLEANNYDSALYYLKIGDALSPNRPNVQNNLGITYLNLGNLKQAENYFKKAFELDTLTSTYAYSMARYYRYVRDVDNEVKYLEIAISKNDAKEIMFKDLVVDYLYIGEIRKAKEIFRKYEFLRSDSLFINSLNPEYRKIILNN